MSTDFSLFHRLAKRLGTFNAAATPSQELPTKPAQHGADRLSARVTRAGRMRVTWQAHQKMAQTPSNLM